MIILLAWLTRSVAGVICEFCNKDFISLGRHTWRCKSRAAQVDENIKINCPPLSSKATVVTQNENNEVITQVNQDIDPHENEKKVCKFRCYCGREFKSVRGLNTHRRSYFLGKTPSIAELFEDEDAVGEINDIPTNDNENNLTGLIDLPKGEIKNRVFLPNSVQDLESANEFFRTNIYHSANIEDVNSEIRDIQNTIYNYFSETHG